jgi:hypothetical protein
LSCEKSLELAVLKKNTSCALAVKKKEEFVKNFKLFFLHEK